MIAELEITPPPANRRREPVESRQTLSLVAVSSEPMQRAGNGGSDQPSRAVSFPLKASGTDSRRVSYSRIEAHLVGRSAAWLRRRNGKAGVHAAAAGAVGAAPTGLSKLPGGTSAIAELFEHDEESRLERRAVAAAIVALRGADAVIAGPLSADDINATGMVLHLADLARRAYRALRPPRELLVHPGFAQAARRFHFIQMSHNEARTLAAGAVDIGILSQRLRQLEGAQGEFAITRFSGEGLVWADRPIMGDRTDRRRRAGRATGGGAFCAAWVMARRFLSASVPSALAYARSAAAASDEQGSVDCELDIAGGQTTRLPTAGA